MCEWADKNLLGTGYQKKKKKKQKDSPDLQQHRI